MLPTNFPISCLCRKKSALNKCIHTLCRVEPDLSSFDPKSRSSCSRGRYWGEAEGCSQQLHPADTTASYMRPLFLQHEDKLLMVNLFNFKLYQRREFSCSQICGSQELECTQPFLLIHSHWVITGINCVWEQFYPSKLTPAGYSLITSQQRT